MPPGTTTITPLPIVGAEVSVDLSSLVSLPSSGDAEDAAFREAIEAAIPAPVAEELRTALKEHGLLLMRDQTPSPQTASELLALAAVFAAPGALFDPVKAIQFEPDGGGVRGKPMVRQLGTAGESKLCRMGYEWHVDASDLTIMYCAKAPDSGAETLFASACGLYEALPPREQALVDELEVVYSSRYSAGGPAWLDAELGLRMNSTGTRLHRAATARKEGWALDESPPLPATRERSGRRSLVLSPKNLDHCVGYTHAESQDLCHDLLLAGLGPVDPAPVDDATLLPTRATRFGPAVWEHQWREGDLVVWDNGTVAHSTTPVGLYGKGERRMLQIMFSGERVVGEANAGHGFLMNPGGGQGKACASAAPSGAA